MWLLRILALALPATALILVLSLADPSRELAVVLASALVLLLAIALVLVVRALWRLIPDALGPIGTREQGTWTRDPHGYWQRAVALYRQG